MGSCSGTLAISFEITHSTNQTYAETPLITRHPDRRAEHQGIFWRVPIIIRAEAVVWLWGCPKKSGGGAPRPKPRGPVERNRRHIRLPDLEIRLAHSLGDERLHARSQQAPRNPLPPVARQDGKIQG